MVPNITANGAAAQYSADITEHCHITEVKDPARSGNNQNYDQQIACALDREDKRRRFDLVTSIKVAGVDFRALDSLTGDNDEEDSDKDKDEEKSKKLQRSADLLSVLNPVSNTLFGPRRKMTDYFKKSAR